MFVLDFEFLNVYNVEYDVLMLKNLVMNKLNMEELFCDVVFFIEYVIVNNEKLLNKNRNIGSFFDLIILNILIKS